jgi:hypothetical protein
MKSMTKEQLLRHVRENHGRWFDAVARLDRDMMLEPAIAGGRTPKDVVAHVTWYEKEAAGVLLGRALGGSELWDRPQPERNATILAENRDRPLDDVLSEAEKVFSGLVALIEALEEADLHDPSRFANMPEEWEPWELVAENSYLHYQGHLPEIAALLDREDG